MRPRVLGSRDKYSTSSRICPELGVGIAISSRAEGSQSSLTLRPGRENDLAARSFTHNDISTMSLRKRICLPPFQGRHGQMRLALPALEVGKMSRGFSGFNALTASGNANFTSLRLKQRYRDVKYTSSAAATPPTASLKPVQLFS
jgi:hypothetical protein